jgi:hypothetical protein
MFERLHGTLHGDRDQTTAFESDEEDNEPELPKPTLCVNLVKYTDGNLERKSMSVGTTNYIAISHVWGDASWQHVAGIGYEVLVSDEKARFLAERLNGLVGEEYFWMDILCVEQRDKAARVAVTQHIPTIFRNAQRTIVVRDSSGMKDCCVKELGDLNIWFTASQAQAFQEHAMGTHEHQDLREGALTRLWPLQEILLSDNIQCSQFGLACLACSSSGLEQWFKPAFLTPPACLSMISVRLIACKQFEQAHRTGFEW